jgi:uncharacterized protein (DUF2147 family)
MIRFFLVLAAAFALSTPALAAGEETAIGLWRNIRNTMHIEVRHCGDTLCGRVAWASDEALADAKKGGTRDLVGTEILRDFRPDPKGGWRGKVYVPDLDKTFSGTLVVVDRNTLKGSGCLLGRVLCKNKVLVRIQ